MTMKQIEEFSKLEMQYMSAVYNDDLNEQVKFMELIFFWLKKQLEDRYIMVTIGTLPRITQDEACKVTPGMKGEFTILQGEVIKVAFKKDLEKMAELELLMRTWIDKQIEIMTNKIIRPEFKIFRN
jgi:hypothetical protein